MPEKLMRITIYIQNEIESVERKKIEKRKQKKKKNCPFTLDLRVMI